MKKKKEKEMHVICNFLVNENLNFKETSNIRLCCEGDAFVGGSGRQSKSLCSLKHFVVDAHYLYLVLDAHFCIRHET